MNYGERRYLTNKMKDWDLFVDDTPLDGAWNMAVDEYLFWSIQERSHTFLRFYMWKRPTISLGYYQKIENVINRESCKKYGVDLVRRITGGKLVLHYQEITYCLCSSNTHIFTDSLGGSYRLISEALVLGLKKLGIEASLAEETPSHYARGNSLCFSSPAQNEIEARGKKLIGSAQKRTGSYFLQHGSIPIKEDESLLRKVSFFDKKKEGIRMSSLQTLLNREVNFNEVVIHLSQGFSEYFKVNLKPRILTDQEKAIIKDIQKQKYGNPEWTENRTESTKR